MRYAPNPDRLEPRNHCSIGLAAQTPAPAPQTTARQSLRRHVPPLPPRVRRCWPFRSPIRSGTPLAETQVTITGPVARDGVTTTDGSLRLSNMRAGTYRVRFAREGSITLERELTMRAGESLTIDVSLSPAPVMPKGARAGEGARAASDKGDSRRPANPKSRRFRRSSTRTSSAAAKGRKDSPLGCTPTGTATLHQIREAWLNHAHEEADEWIYVVAGEGTLRIGAAEQRVQAGTFSLVPYATSHALVPQGRNPLIVISVLSGPRCQG